MARQIVLQCFAEVKKLQNNQENYPPHIPFTETIGILRPEPKDLGLTLSTGAV